jgi:hypothetical protein
VADGFLQSVAPCDDDGNVTQGPADSKARTLRFAINPSVKEPPKDQLELKQGVESALSAIRRLYPDPANEKDFRSYFVQLAGAAQVGLVGSPAYPDVGKLALAGIVSDLIDHEGGRIKNKHLRDLAVQSAWLSAPLLISYCLICVIGSPKSGLEKLLKSLYIVPITASSFLVMLVGCFLGVTLSYAARTTTLTLADLLAPDTERLRPIVRLLVSAGWAVIIGYFLSLEVVVFQVGDVTTRVFGFQPSLAFLLGAMCGLSNLTLPGSVLKKVNELLPGK